MSYVLGSYRSQKRAQRGLRHWIRIQKVWDRAFQRIVGQEVYPPASEVYRVERRGSRFCVVFDDPTMG